MGNMVQHMGNITPTISTHHFKDLWKSPRGTVLRIEALTIVAIIITFFVAAFGSCRRWSNRWIVQKGFFAAHALSLSLGTYSIGLMQSSPVKSKTYPLWTVSLFTLFVCIDPVTTYNGLDYKGPLSKMVYGICLNFGYVMLMILSTTSSGIGSRAICMLCALTFIKGFHKSLALVQQSRMRNLVQHHLYDSQEEKPALLTNNDGTQTQHAWKRQCLVVDVPPGSNDHNQRRDMVTLAEIDEVLMLYYKEELCSCYDACIAFGMSHKLHRHFLGVSSYVPEGPSKPKDINYNWALKVIEIELSFLYEMFFTGNAFLHYYQAKAASLWSLASFVGICIVGVAAAIPGTMDNHCTTSGPGGCSNVVDTATADLVITFVILVCLALLQLMQLLWCWTSNWARLAIACAYARNRKKEIDFLAKVKNPASPFYGKQPKKESYWLKCWMKLKAFIATRSNLFDKYLWQEKLSQYSILPEGLPGKKGKEKWPRTRRFIIHRLYWFARLAKMLGLDYIGEVLWDLLGTDSNKRTAVSLDDDVKAPIIDFLTKIESDILDVNWLSISDIQPFVSPFSDFIYNKESRARTYTKYVLKWYTATWFCQLAEEDQGMQDSLSEAEERMGWMGIAYSYLKRAVATVASVCFRKAEAAGGKRGENRDRHVANALSKYCAYLMVSVPELLPGPVFNTRKAFHKFAEETKQILDTPDMADMLRRATSDIGFMEGMSCSYMYPEDYSAPPVFWEGMLLASTLLRDGTTRRRCDPWKVLAVMWVRILVYAAPYGNVEAHMRHLAQGGEFITHLWALLYELNIREWKLPDTKLPKTVQHIGIIDHAKSILTNNDKVVMAFLNSIPGSYTDELNAAFNLEDDVSFYWTTNPDVAKLFHIDPAAKGPSLVLVKKEDKFTIYDGEFRANAIADFVSVSKERRHREQTEGEIEEEVPP